MSYRRAPARRDVEAGGLETLKADAVGFLLVLTGEVDLHLNCQALGRCDRGLGCLAAARAVRTRGENRRRERRDRREHRVPLISNRARDVVLSDVGDFVGEHRSELRLGLSQENEAGVDADIPSRQRKRVDAVVGDGEEFEVEGRSGNRGHQAVAELVQVTVDLGVVHVPAGEPNLADDRLAELPLLRG